MGKRKNDEEEEEDEFEIGIDDEDAGESIKAGMEQGFKAGVKSGAAEGLKPMAKEAGKKAVELMMGGKKSPVKEAMEDVAEALKLQAFQATLENMKHQNKPQAMAQPLPNPSPDVNREMGEMLETLAKFGIPPDKILDQIGVQGLLAMVNPKFAPLMSLMGNHRKESSNMDLLPIIQMMQNQQHTTPESKDNGMATIITAMMQQNQMLMQQMYETQQRAQEAQQRLLVEQFKPFMHRGPSFSEELGEMQEKMAAFKNMGLFGNSGGNRTDVEAQYDFESRKLAIELEKEKLRMQQGMQIRQAELESEREKQDMTSKLIETAQGFIKNLKLELPSIQPQQMVTDPNTLNIQPTNTATAQGGKKPITQEVSSRINRMLRVAYNNQKGEDENGEQESE